MVVVHVDKWWRVEGRGCGVYTGWRVWCVYTGWRVEGRGCGVYTDIVLFCSILLLT